MHDSWNQRQHVAHNSSKIFKFLSLPLEKREKTTHSHMKSVVNTIIRSLNCLSSLSVYIQLELRLCVIFQIKKHQTIHFLYWNCKFSSTSNNFLEIFFVFCYYHRQSHWFLSHNQTYYLRKKRPFKRNFITMHTKLNKFALYELT